MTALLDPALLDVSPHVLLILTLVAFAAGVIDSIAGGGGLLALPAVLLAGAPPLTALATNKLQGMFGTASAALSYARAGQVSLRTQGLPALLALMGGAGGSLVASHLPADAIRLALPVVLIGVALYFAFKKGLDDQDRHVRMGAPLFALTLVPLLALYDGVLGPGTGSFLMLAFVSLRGMGLLRATAHTKLLNLASNAGSMAVFALVASPWWLVGLAMGVAQALGAQVGSRLAVRGGARLIRPLLVTVSVALALRLLWQAWA